MKVKIEFAFDLADRKTRYIDTSLMEPSRFFHHQYLIRLIDEARRDRMGWSPTDITLAQYNEVFDREFDWDTMSTIPKAFEYDGESQGFDCDVGIYVIEKEFKGVHPGLSAVLAAETNDEKYDAFVKEFENYRAELIPELDPTIFNDPLLVARLDRWVNEKAASQRSAEDYVFNLAPEGILVTPMAWRQNGVPDMTGLKTIPFADDVLFLMPGDVIEKFELPVKSVAFNPLTGVWQFASSDASCDYSQFADRMVEAGFVFDEELELGELPPSNVDKLFEQFTIAKDNSQIVQSIASQTSDLDVLDQIHNAKTPEEVLEAIKKVIPNATLGATGRLDVGGNLPISDSMFGANGRVASDAFNPSLTTLDHVELELSSLDQNEQIVEQIKSGRSLRDIAKEYGIGHQAVGRIGEKAGVFSSRSKKNKDK
jgi:hypothetical protein